MLRRCVAWCRGGGRPCATDSRLGGQTHENAALQFACARHGTGIVRLILSVDGARIDSAGLQPGMVLQF